MSVWCRDIIFSEEEKKRIFRDGYTMGSRARFEAIERRKEAKKDADSPISQRIMNLDTSLIARDVRFFYPYEVQVVDDLSHNQNTQGEASHIEYKKAQRRSAMKRVFKELLAYKNLI